jgi:hypothetical protein
MIHLFKTDFWGARHNLRELFKNLAVRQLNLNTLPLMDGPLGLWLAYISSRFLAGSFGLTGIWMILGLQFYI